MKAHEPCFAEEVPELKQTAIKSNQVAEEVPTRSERVMANEMAIESKPLVSGASAEPSNQSVKEIGPTDT